MYLSKPSSPTVIPLPRSAVSSQSLTFFIWTEGIAPSVTLLHGVGLNADAWGRQIETLANYFTVKAFDMPGHGESPELAMASPKLNDYVAAIKQHIIEPTVVVGHSMGAMIALKLAIKKEVVGVVALNAVFQRSSCLLYTSDAADE